MLTCNELPFENRKCEIYQNDLDCDSDDYIVIKKQGVKILYKIQ